MANTFTQIYLHVVFAVAARTCVINAERKEELQKYLAGIVSGQGQKSIAGYCRPGHTHILLGIKPDVAPSSLIGKIKSGSTNHINEQRWFGCRFWWQEGFGAFSVSHSHLSRVVQYIRDQDRHHRHKSFRSEYLGFLERHQISHDERYTFASIE